MNDDLNTSLVQEYLQLNKKDDMTTHEIPLMRRSSISVVDARSGALDIDHDTPHRFSTYFVDKETLEYRVEEELNESIHNFIEPMNSTTFFDAEDLLDEQEDEERTRKVWCFPEDTFHWLLILFVAAAVVGVLIYLMDF